MAPEHELLPHGAGNVTCNLFDSLLRSLAVALYALHFGHQPIA